MKRMGWLIILLMLVFLCGTASAEEGPWPGDGTENNPWVISTSDDLAMLQQMVDAGNDYAGEFFILDRDIDLENREWTPIGSQKRPFGSSFDGANFTISGLNVNTSGDYAGLFGVTEGSSGISNLTVEGHVNGRSYIGGIVGNGTGTMDHCTFNGTVTGTGYYVGGIAGEFRGQMGYCTNNGNVTGNYDAVGGLIGMTRDPDFSLSWCTNNGEVTAAGDYAGGLVGMINIYGDTAGHIDDTNRNTGTVAGCQYVGGIAGYVSNEFSAVNEGEVIGALNAGTVYGYAEKAESAGTITLHANDGSSYAAGQPIKGSIPLTPGCIFSKEDYTFYAWNTEANGSGVWYYAGQEIDQPSEMELYAIWNIPAFTDADFILPAELTRIEAGAFEGDTQITAVDAHNCTFVGAEAFGSCSGLRQIRLDGECRIDGSAFDGCGTLYIYAPAGGSTEDYCRDNGDLIFIGE